MGKLKAEFQIAPQARVLHGDMSGLVSALSDPGRPFRLGGLGPLVAARGEFETLTSGSLGVARHIRRTMASWIGSFDVNAGLFGIGPGVRVAVLGGMEQSLALYGAVEALHLGADLYALGGMRPDRARRILADHAVEVVYGAPAQLRLLADAGGAALAHLRLVLVGGAKLDAGLRALIAAMAPGAVVREFYGAAETSFVTLSAPGDPPDSVGSAYPGVEIEAPDHVPGPVWVRSPYLFMGYAGGESGGAVWRDGWLSVGEMGWLSGGHLYLAGRAGRMVTVAGHNVFPEAIEAFLLAQRGVTRAAVLPRDDTARGVHLVAVVQGEAGHEPAIMAALRAELGAVKAPKALIWRQDWPLLGSGKTDLAALARQVAP